MAHCSEKVEKLKFGNDSEVENVFSENPEKLPDINDKPLSPILISSTLNRKFIFGKRAMGRKSRVKLSDKFGDVDSRPKGSNDDKEGDSQVQDFTEDSFTMSQTENLMNCLEQLEKIEKNRKTVYKLIVGNKTDDFCFKKPISPAPSKPKKMKCHFNSSAKEIKPEIDDHSDQTVDDFDQNFAPLHALSDIPKWSGFQTATGKKVSFSEQEIKKQEKLFEDILTPSQVHDLRKNKYNFLSVNDRVRRKVSNEEKNALMSGDSCEKTAENEYDVSLTQEMSNSEISNTQIIFAIDNALNSHNNSAEGKESGFLGFNREEIIKSEAIYKQVAKIYGKSLQSGNKNKENIIKNISFLVPKLTEQPDIRRNKRLLDNPNSPLRKKMKQETLSHPKSYIPELKEICPQFEGFSSASGRTISISSSSLKVANDIFAEIDSEMIQDKELISSVNSRSRGRSSFKGSSSDKTISNSGCNRESSKKEVATHTTMKSSQSSNIVNDESKFSGEMIGNSEKGYDNNEIRLDVPRSLDTNSPLRKKMKQELVDHPKRQMPVLKEICPQFEGFLSASGRPIAISSSSIKVANNIFAEIESDLMKDKTLNSFVNGPSSSKGSSLGSSSDKIKSNYNCSRESAKEEVATVKSTSNDESQSLNIVQNKLTFSENAIRNSSELKADAVPVNYDFGFSSASGKSIKVSGKFLEVGKTIFADIEKNSTSSQAISDSRKTSPANVRLDVSRAIDNKLKLKSSKESLHSVKDKLKFFDALIDSNNVDSLSIDGSNTLSSNNNVEIPDELIKVRPTVDTGIEQKTPVKNCKVTPQQDAKSKLKLLDEAIKLAEEKGLHNSSFSALSSSKSNFSSSETARNSSLKEIRTPGTCQAPKVSSFSTPTRANLKTPFGSSSKQLNKRKLGISSCKPIPISDTNLHRAKQLFQEEFLDMSPIRPIRSIPQTSTPITQNFTTPNKNINVTPSRCLSSFENTTDTTVLGNVEEEKNEFLLRNDLLVKFGEPTKICGRDLERELEDERNRLAKRLQVIRERQEVLITMKMENVDDTKPRLGILYLTKLRQDRIPLHIFVGDRKPGETSNNELFSISPKNAENIQFKESSAKLQTKDGATVVPDSQDMIGLLEIEHALKSMPGVEARLIPKGWIRNHYKWIIWKLASYERMFPLHFSGSLNVEHVIQQLKYRYDREVDKAERPALRRIYEKDDASQKRMVLCVSDVKKVNSNKYELELTDGWYGIRTVVDNPLCNQIQKGRIKIGTKLMTCGAELINCDGCFPLEVTDLTFLRINYNSTRRAIWNARLGYQRFPGPFPVPIHSIHPMGGLIGAIQITIARVYPIKYLEKSDGRSVWRNKRAEERRAQQWEVERCKKIEKIEDNLRKEFSNCSEKVASDYKLAERDISNINCPQILFTLLENTNDPDSLQTKLSSSQRSSIEEYKQNLFQKKHQQMSYKMNAEKLKMVNRDVVPVLQLLVVDINGSPTRAFNLSIWRPSESHFEILREGFSVTAYSVLPKMNGDLSCTSKTVFKADTLRDHMSEIFRRKVIEIGEISDMKFSVNFSEFDTVGIVVQTKLDERLQEVWLGDLSGRLLLIRINEGPDTCLLIDNLRRGQAVTVCNLKFRCRTDDVSQAIGNHFTVFSCYSQHKHLQEFLESFKKAMPKSCDKLLDDCDNKIEKFLSKPNLSPVNLEENEEDTLVWSRITSTDLALSLIDMDEFA